LHIEGKTSGTTTELAFSDARRLGRVRLAVHPKEEPPISELGFDPILSMPPLWEFQALVLKRSCPIKALLLDQSFSAGVGNYLAGKESYWTVNVLSHGICHQMKYYIKQRFTPNNGAILCKNLRWKLCTVK
jgi:formamidopyrimidine-DNA glycosylase